MTTLTAPGFAVIPEGDQAAARAWNEHSLEALDEAEPGRQAPS
jgi:hypothetical protein